MIQRIEILLPPSSTQRKLIQKEEKLKNEERKRNEDIILKRRRRQQHHQQQQSSNLLLKGVSRKTRMLPNCTEDIKTPVGKKVGSVANWEKELNLISTQRRGTFSEISGTLDVVELLQRTEAQLSGPTLNQRYLNSTNKSGCTVVLLNMLRSHRLH